MTKTLEKPKEKKVETKTLEEDVKSVWLKRDIRVYLFGPYITNTEKNLATAIDLTWKLMNMKYTVVSAHLLYYVEKEHPDWTLQQWIDYNCKLMSMCDCVYMFGSWEKDESCKAEIEYAKTHFIPVLKTMKELEIYTEHWFK